MAIMTGTEDRLWVWYHNYGGNVGAAQCPIPEPEKMKGSYYAGWQGNSELSR